MYKSFSMELAGRTLSVDIGRVAAQANGAAFMRYGDTVVLSTATASEKPVLKVPLNRCNFSFTPILLLLDSIGAKIKRTVMAKIERKTVSTAQTFISEL